MKMKKLLGIVLLLLFASVGCSNVTKEDPVKEEPPEAVVMIHDEKIQTTKGTYSWETKGLFSNNAVIADAAAPYQIAEEMESKLVEADSIANVDFSDGSKPQLEAYLWEDEGRGKQLSLNKSRLSLPSQSGNHVIEIFAIWSNGEASYTFVV
ncbi:hypothetical protein [Virgibacillus oceani]|uniref:Lipoprotein n=1 Tax=Virgibacillus oceani TaxID=1479511 RepID=A0A917HDV6_9BACI|nr:hypothetical protein [Virgibacillus oceani]GGG76114.1 hypothetical protein GCM10011398_21270 [Virgibacillus oceani]